MCLDFDLILQSLLKSSYIINLFVKNLKDLFHVHVIKIFESSEIFLILGVFVCSFLKIRNQPI